MLEFLGAAENLAFASALLLMLLIGAVEALGLGGGAIGGDMHADGDPDSGDLLAWLGVGTLPLLMVLVIFLALFGSLGLAGQQIAATVIGAPLSGWIAVPVATLVALPLTGFAARGLARILPRDETTAIDLDDLVGRRAMIVVGTAAIGSPARARTEDHHGQSHFVMVEPNSDAERFREGDMILIVRREGHGFRAIAYGDALSPGL